ncbi:hypothetical protein GXW82_16675 [Streptacidiphilus sp. 4-A2]|nr:hypothetical protein [Streptacidiphilus sp. 4-A2]
MELNIGHVSYNGTGSHAAITSATVQVSFDGGATWQTARLSRTVPRRPGTGSQAGPTRRGRRELPLDPDHRHRCAGGSIEQTVNHAYEIVKGA